MNRRTFLQASGAALVSSNLTAVGRLNAPDPRLRSRPKQAKRVMAAGLTRHPVGETSVVTYLPERALALERVPLMVFLHGANRTVDAFMERFLPVADATGVMLMMPFAMVGTWDAIRYFFGPDVAAIDASLAWCFDEVPIDPRRITLSGFSDGATYALALGRANGDLFTRVVAYSPGFLIPVKPVGRPPIVISHGRQDRILPFENASETIVPTLTKAGYAVDFHPFDGPHTVLMDVVEREMKALGAGAS